MSNSRFLLVAMLAVCLAVGLAGVGAQGPGDGAGGGQGRGGQRAGRGQAPARDAANQPVQAGTGSISGSVTLAGSSSPVRRAQVTLSGGGRGGRSSLTNEEGRFAFVGL